MQAEAASPRIKRSFSIIGHSPDVVELRHGAWNTVSHTLRDDSGSGRLLGLITGLDGTLGPAELAELHEVEQGEVNALLAHLQALEVIEHGPSSALEHYLDVHAGPLRAARPPEPRTVRLLGDPDLAELTAGLVGAAIPDAHVVQATDDPALEVLDPEPGWARDELWLNEAAARFDHFRDGIVVWARHRPDLPRTEVFNRIALRQDIAWVHGAIDGPFMMVGPVFRPGATACYQCLETRVLMNLKNSAAYQRYKTALAHAAAAGGDLPVLAPLSHLLASYLALEAVNLYSADGAYTTGKAFSIYLPTWEHTVEDVLPVPGCPACGGTEEDDLYFDAGAWLDADD